MNNYIKAVNLIKEAYKDKNFGGWRSDFKQRRLSVELTPKLGDQKSPEMILVLTL